MVDTLTALQLLLSMGLAVVIAERAHYLMYTAQLSPTALSWLREQIEAGHRDELLSFGRALPRTHVARLVQAMLSEEDAAEVLSDLTERALARLRVVRVGATLASTIGLLIGILRLSGSTSSPGLLALEAGLPQRIATAQALWAMGIGVGTSAVCFYALSLLSKAAKELLTQTSRTRALLSPPMTVADRGM